MQISVYLDKIKIRVPDRTRSRTAAPGFLWLSPDRCSIRSITHSIRSTLSLLLLSSLLLSSLPTILLLSLILPPIHSFLFPFSDLLFSASLLLGRRLSLNNRVCLHLARFFFYLLQPTLLPSLPLITLCAVPDIAFLNRTCTPPPRAATFIPLELPVLLLHLPLPPPTTSSPSLYLSLIHSHELHPPPLMELPSPPWSPNGPRHGL
jgi:hypothetical protein